MWRDDGATVRGGVALSEVPVLVFSVDADDPTLPVTPALGRLMPVASVGTEFMCTYPHPDPQLRTVKEIFLMKEPHDSLVTEKKYIPQVFVKSDIKFP